MDLKRAIKATGWTLDAVAKQMQGRDGVGISLSAMSQIIGGNPSLSKLEEVAGIIGVPLWQLIREAADDGTAPAVPGVCPHCGHPLEIVIK